MTALLTPLADAIVTDLNDSGLLPTTAVRSNVPQTKREDLSSLSVIVTPIRKVGESITRAKQKYTIDCYVLLQKGLTTDSNSATDTLIELGEAITTRYDHGKQLAVGSLVANCVGAVFGADEDTSFLAIARRQEALEYFGAILLRFELME
jgi:hypothetical protein